MSGHSGRLSLQQHSHLAVPPILFVDHCVDNVRPFEATRIAQARYRLEHTAAWIQCTQQNYFCMGGMFPPWPGEHQDD